MKTLLEKLGFTRGFWAVPHFAQEDFGCECGYVFTKEDPGCRTVCTVHKHDTYDEWDQYFPIEEAKRNAKVIAYSLQLLDIVLDMRKFMERLPCEWYSEHRVANIDDVLESILELNFEEIQEIDRRVE